MLLHIFNAFMSHTECQMVWFFQWESQEQIYALKCKAVQQYKLCFPEYNVLSLFLNNFLQSFQLYIEVGFAKILQSISFFPLFPSALLRMSLDCLAHSYINKFYFFTRASLVAQMVKNLPATGETQVWSLNREDPLEKDMAAHSSILAWRISLTE